MFKFSLVTPSKKIVNDIEVKDIVIPAHRGEINILPGHSPLMTTLSTGILKFKRAESSDYETAVVSWGYCEIGPEGVNVLAETAESLEEIDKVRAEVAAKKAEEQLVNPDLEVNQIEKYQRKLKRAQARIDISN